MTLLFSEKGQRVACFDTDKESVQKVMQQAKEDPNVDESKVHGFTKLEKLVDSFPTNKDGNGKPRILVLSLPHGSAADGVWKDVKGLLNKGDIILDCGNEYWADTKRRQKEVEGTGIEWVGCGVSGGCECFAIVFHSPPWSRM